MIFLIALLLAGDTSGIVQKRNTDMSFGLTYPWGAMTQITYWWTPDIGTSLVTQAYKEYSSDISKASSIELIQYYRKSFWKSLFCGIGSGAGIYMLTENDKNSPEFGIPVFLSTGFWLSKNTGIYVKLPGYYLFRDSEFNISSTVIIGLCKRY